MRKTALIIICAVLAGCSSHPLQLSGVDPARPYEVLPRASVTATGITLLGILPFGMATREVRARNLLLKNSGGDDLIDPAISSRYIFTPVANFHKIQLTATPIKYK